MFRIARICACTVDFPRPARWRSRFDQAARIGLDNGLEITADLLQPVLSDRTCDVVKQIADFPHVYSPGAVLAAFARMAATSMNCGAFQ